MIESKNYPSDYTVSATKISGPESELQRLVKRLISANNTYHELQNTLDINLEKILNKKEPLDEPMPEKSVSNSCMLDNLENEIRIMEKINSKLQGSIVHLSKII